jgi:hypothetical protein
MGIVDGSGFCPPQFSSEEHKVRGITNSAYMVWQYKDQTILGWIISSLSPTVVSTKVVKIAILTRHGTCKPNSDRKN